MRILALVVLADDGLHVGLRKALPDQHLLRILAQLLGQGRQYLMAVCCVLGLMLGPAPA